MSVSLVLVGYTVNVLIFLHPLLLPFLLSVRSVLKVLLYGFLPAHSFAISDLNEHITSFESSASAPNRLELISIHDFTLASISNISSHFPDTQVIPTCNDAEPIVKTNSSSASSSYRSKSTKPSSGNESQNGNMTPSFISMALQPQNTPPLFPKPTKPPLFPNPPLLNPPSFLYSPPLFPNPYLCLILLCTLSLLGLHLWFIILQTLQGIFQD